MKAILTFLLALLLSTAAHAQNGKIIFRMDSSVTYAPKLEKMKNEKPKPYKGLIIFKSKEVRFNDGSAWKDIVYPVRGISSRKKGRYFTWTCGDRSFLLDIHKMMVTCSFKESEFKVIYYGTFFFGEKQLD